METLILKTIRQMIGPSASYKEPNWVAIKKAGVI